MALRLRAAATATATRAVLARPLCSILPLPLRPAPHRLITLRPSSSSGTSASSLFRATTIGRLFSTTSPDADIKKSAAAVASVSVDEEADGGGGGGGEIPVGRVRERDEAVVELEREVARWARERGDAPERVVAEVRAIWAKAAGFTSLDAWRARPLTTPGKGKFVSGGGNPWSALEGEARDAAAAAAAAAGSSSAGSATATPPSTYEWPRRGKTISESLQKLAIDYEPIKTKYQAHVDREVIHMRYLALQYRLKTDKSLRDHPEFVPSPIPSRADKKLWLRTAASFAEAQSISDRLLLEDQLANPRRYGPTADDEPDDKSATRKHSRNSRDDEEQEEAASASEEDDDMEEAERIPVPADVVLANDVRRPPTAFLEAEEDTDQDEVARDQRLTLSASDRAVIESGDSKGVAAIMARAHGKREKSIMTELVHEVTNPKLLKLQRQGEDERRAARVEILRRFYGELEEPMPAAPTPTGYGILDEHHVERVEAVRDWLIIEKQRQKRIKERTARDLRWLLTPITEDELLRAARGAPFTQHAPPIHWMNRKMIQHYHAIIKFEHWTFDQKEEHLKRLRIFVMSAFRNSEKIVRAREMLSLRKKRQSLLAKK